MIELLDVRGTLAIENGLKVITFVCQIFPLQRLQMQTSHLPNDQLVSITITGKIILSDPPQSFITSIE